MNSESTRSRHVARRGCRQEAGRPGCHCLRQACWLEQPNEHCRRCTRGGTSIDEYRFFPFEVIFRIVLEHARSGCFVAGPASSRQAHSTHSIRLLVCKGGTRDRQRAHHGFCESLAARAVCQNSRSRKITLDIGRGI